jgi:hypothetical protein
MRKERFLMVGKFLDCLLQFSNQRNQRDFRGSRFLVALGAEKKVIAEVKSGKRTASIPTIITKLLSLLWW